MSNQSEKLLASISYFSVFFAPFIFPIIVWILGDKPVSEHAKRSLIYHLLPYILIFGGILLFAFGLQITNSLTQSIFIIISILAFLGAIYYVIYNIYCGVKVLISDNL